jgi:hypothetical protein
LRCSLCTCWRAGGRKWAGARAERGQERFGCRGSADGGGDLGLHRERARDTVSATVVVGYRTCVRNGPCLYIAVSDCFECKRLAHNCARRRRAGPFVQVHSLSCSESSFTLDPFSHFKPPKPPAERGSTVALCHLVGECSRQYKRRPLPSRRACVWQPGKRHAWRAKFSDPASRCRKPAVHTDGWGGWRKVWWRNGDVAQGVRREHVQKP